MFLFVAMGDDLEISWWYCDFFFLVWEETLLYLFFL